MQLPGTGGEGATAEGKGCWGALRNDPEHRRGAGRENAVSPADLVKLNCKIINLIITYCLPTPYSWLSEEELANVFSKFQSLFSNLQEV